MYIILLCYIASRYIPIDVHLAVDRSTLVIGRFAFFDNRACVICIILYRYLLQFIITILLLLWTI